VAGTWKVPVRWGKVPPVPGGGDWHETWGAPMSALFSLLAALQAALCSILILHVMLQLTLARSYLRRPARARTAARADDPGLPYVTVQLPVYNERHVVERLIDRVAALRYPRDRLEIQVLDDSTDETVKLAAARIAHQRAQGLNIRHIHRPNRADFKAGALRHGLESAKGEFVAIFDADFLPDPDFLLVTIPHFAAPDVAMVQTRWGHANQGDSLLTQVQSLMLDTHLTVEQVGRAEQNCFFNFNGTAGVWRAAAIRDAGNWSGDTLTEDLDLSYRAQLKGWRFLYLDDAAATGDLPDNVRAFRSQQYRWIKGGAQCAARLLGSVFRADLAWKVKVQAAEHLLETSFYLVFLALVVLTVPMAAISGAEVRAIWLAPVLLFAFSMSGLIAVYAAPQRRRTRSVGGALRFLSLWGGFIVVSTGLVVHNGLAALSGLVGSRSGEFVRTPKRDTTKTTRWNRTDGYLPKGLGRTFVLEVLLWLYLAAGVVLGIRNGTAALILGPMLAFLGLSYMLGLCLRDFAMQWAEMAKVAPGPAALSDD
jgi:cellulose synthase/poly-beta-1,6-N-acetylglucosamine synthase-like glycosyltransferase